MKQKAALLIPVVLAAGAAQLASESLTLTTSYPSPAGIYRSLVTTMDTMLARDGGRVGVGTSAPHPSSVLELASNSRGFLPPRLSTGQRDAIASPAPGLTIFNTTSRTFEYYDGSAWRRGLGAGRTWVGKLAVSRTFGGSQRTLVNLPINTQGGAVQVSGKVTGYASGNPHYAYFYVYLYRDGVNVDGCGAAISETGGLASCTVLDAATLPPGPHSYRLNVRGGGGTWTAIGGWSMLSVSEL